MYFKMNKGFFKIIGVVIAFGIFTKCAQISPLTGGERDILPPKIVEAMPINKAVNFNSDIIVLKFNEFVQIKDVANQLIINPKLKTEPEIEADGKTITIKIKKAELLPKTTYRFYFGNAIADMHEGNILTNFNYVFSTANYIDTLRLSGTIIEEFNGKPIADMLVGLYDGNELTDSLCYKTTPNYYCKTNQNGEFVFENLPSNHFKVIAFTDKNKNFLYDGEIEKIAVRDSDLFLKKDSSIKLNAFQEEATKSFIKKINSPYYGYSNIIYNKRSNIKLVTLNKLDEKNVYFPLNSTERDTLEVFYKNTNDTLKLLCKNAILKKIDTLNVVIPKSNSTLKKFTTIKANLSGGNLLLNSNLELTFSSMIDTVKTNIFKLKLLSKEDTLIAKTPVKAIWISPYKLQLTAKFKQATNYTLKIDTAIFYLENKFYNDSSILNFKTEAPTDYGKLTLKLLLNKKQNYNIQLINDKEQVVRENYVALSLAGSNSKAIDFIDVLPGTYRVKIIFDDNDDKKWNTGNYLQKKQPERIIIYAKPIKVLSDWEVEEEIIIKE